MVKNSYLLEYKDKLFKSNELQLKRYGKYHNTDSREHRTSIISRKLPSNKFDHVLNSPSPISKECNLQTPNNDRFPKRLKNDVPKCGFNYVKH